MNRLIVSVVIAFCFILSAQGKQPMKGFEKEIEKKLELTEWTNVDTADSLTFAKVAQIYIALSLTSEVYMHNMRGAKDNAVYISEDGHKEAVYSNGILVTDCINQGTYNYYHPHKEPLEHFTYDILPWIAMGNCPEDPTTIPERIEAYITDFSVGLSKAIESERNIEDLRKYDFKKNGRKQALAFFLKSFDKCLLFPNADARILIKDEFNQKNFDEYLDKLKVGMKMQFLKMK